MVRLLQAARSVRPLREKSCIIRQLWTAKTWPVRCSSPFMQGQRRDWLSTEIVAVPSMGDSITEGTLVEWSVEVGSAVAEDDLVCAIDTDKVSVEVRSPHSGVLVEKLAEADSVVEVAQPLFKIDTAATAAEGAPAPAAETAAPSPAPSSSPAPAPAPSPSPPPEKKQDATKPTPSPTPAPSAAPKSSRSEKRVKMSRMRLRIAERLKEAQNTAAMLTTFQECDMGNLMALRSKHKDEFEKKHGVKLGFMSAFVKASTAALLETPAVNAIIDSATNEVVYREYCDVSVAVASPNGLVVPVLRDAQDMSFADVEKQIGVYAKKAKEGTLALEDMTGGTFSISNGGVFGSLMGTPIINYSPQAAILGMHATKMRPMVVDGKVEARPMMYLALTYDHRIIDGREAVTFLKSIANKIEDPSRLLFEI